MEQEQQSQRWLVINWVQRVSPGTFQYTSYHRYRIIAVVHGQISCYCCSRPGHLRSVICPLRRYVNNLASTVHNESNVATLVCSELGHHQAPGHWSAIPPQ